MPSCSRACPCRTRSVGIRGSCGSESQGRRNHECTNTDNVPLSAGSRHPASFRGRLLARGEPLFKGNIACPAGTPPGQIVGGGLLNALTDPTKGNALNTAWEQAEPQIEQKTIIGDRIHIPNGCSSDLDAFCLGKLAGSHCSFVYADIELHALTGLSSLRFMHLDVSEVNQRNVAAHSNRGPDASKITDGVVAPEGTSATDPAYAIVLPHNGAAGALVIDLGGRVNICGTVPGCTAPTIQADNDDVYQLDYLDENSGNWISYGWFPKASSSGLRTRSLTCCNFPNFWARYVRVWAVSGGATFAVSELRLSDSSGNLVSVGKPAVGPRPSPITDGVFAPPGTSATNTQYAVVLNHQTGPAPALAIDLGAVVTICGNGWDCLREPLIQADNDDVYQLDYSTDGQNWITYPGTFPSVPNSGLQTRDMQCSARPDLTQPCSATNHGPNFTARYVRVYAVSGGATFAVSELQLWDIGSNLVSLGKSTYGPEPFVSNGEFASDGAAWNDGRYATILPPCKAASSSMCPTSSALTAALLIDLTATFPVDHLVLQANRHQFQVDSSTDGISWTPLWTFPAVSGSGLITRTSPPFDSPQPPTRYLRVYGTAGDDSNYSVSELQVFTLQANTAGAYDGGANDGQNFACSYDGLFTTALGVGTGSSVQPFSTLPIQFYVDAVSLNVHCASPTDSGDYNVAAAHGRQCSMTLVPPSDYGDAPFTDQFQAGYCAPTTAHPQGLGILSYVQFDDNADTSENNSAIQFASKDVVFGDQQGSDLQCSDWDSLAAHIPDLLRGLIPSIAAGAVKSAVNQILDYHENILVPFPRDTSQGAPYPPLKCAGALTGGEPPTPSPDNISGLWGRATQVGNTMNSATLRLLGRFTVEEPLALDRAALTFDALLHDSTAGELVQGPSGSLLVPLSLPPLKGSTPDKGIYRKPPGDWPIVHAQIAPVRGRDAQSGLMEFSLAVKRATILGPAGCAGGPPPTAPLTTSFRLLGGSDVPVWVHTTADWQCNGTQLKTP